MPSPKDIVDILAKAVKDFDGKIPSVQKAAYNELVKLVSGFDFNMDGSLKNSVANLRKINSVRGKLLKVILTPDYKGAVSKYLSVFDEVTTLQNAMFRDLEKTYTPLPVMAEIKSQSKEDVVRSLSEAGVAVNIGDRVLNLLKTSVVSGASYEQLANQLRTLVIGEGNEGVLQRYAKQITTDSVNQYSATIMNTASADLGYEWYRYQGKDITTSRHFCDAMTDQPFFHVSEIPRILRGDGLYYTDKDGQRKKVEIYPKTGLPHGMYADTDASNFFVRRGGYNCGHQIFPVHVSIVPADVVLRVKETGQYQAHKGTPIYDAQKEKTKIETARKRFGAGADSRSLFGKPKNQDNVLSLGDFNETRKEIHKNIINKYVTNTVSQEVPEAQLIGGAPANGKSSLSATSFFKSLKDAIHIDPDMIKGEFSEYKYLLDNRDLKAAAFIHEEASLVSKEIIRKVAESKSNITVDKLFTSEETVKNQVAQLKKLGYGKITINYTTLDTDLSMSLMKKRGEKTGRFVPEDQLLRANALLPKEFKKIISGNYFDELTLWDTNNRTPVKIMTYINGVTKILNEELFARFLKKGGIEFKKEDWQ